MTSIRAIFDGKAFIPSEPVSLPAQSAVTLHVHTTDSMTREQLDAEIRAYYAGGGEDEEDIAWGKFIERDLHRAWDDEDDDKPEQRDGEPPAAR